MALGPFIEQELSMDNVTQSRSWHTDGSQGRADVQLGQEVPRRPSSTATWSQHPQLGPVLPQRLTSSTPWGRPHTLTEPKLPSMQSGNRNVPPDAQVSGQEDPVPYAQVAVGQPQSGVAMTIFL